jgi:eukaryotic-like serine/threonine-protein kinase
MGKLLDARASGMIEIGHYAEAESLLALSAQAHHHAGESLTIYQNPTVVLQTRLLLASGRTAEAASVFRTYLDGEDKPADITRQGVEPLIVRAELALAGGDADSAIRDANQVLTFVSSSANSRYLLSWEMQGSLLAGKAELASGRANNALPLLTRALELGGDLYDQNASPRYADAQIALAECLLALGRVDNAKKLYMGATAIHIMHRELAEHYRKPLQQLKAHLARL